MMERLKQIILLFFVLTISNLVGLNKAFAQHRSVEQQLSEIKQNTNKQQALLELSQLIQSPALNAAEKVLISLQQAKTLFTLHQYNQGIEIVQQARAIAVQADLSSLAAQANKMLGILLYYQGELKPALKAYQTSLAYYDDNQANDVNTFAIERANLLNNIALVYTSLGQPNLALVNYQLAEPLYARYGDETDKIDVRYNIAVLHISLKRFDSAIDMLIVIVKKRLQLQDDYGVAQAKATLGVAYKDSGQFELGIENILAALHYFQAHGYKHDIASQLHNMSEIYNDTFDIEQALFYGKQALAISKEIGHQKAYAGSLQSLAKASFYSGDLLQAEHYIERSVSVGENIDYQALLTENLAISALIYASKQEFVKADRKSVV